MRNALRHPRVCSLLVAIALAAAAAVQLRAGPGSVPAPLVELCSQALDCDAELAARAIVALELALAAAVLCVGSRWLAMASTVAFGFVALSCVSAALRGGGLLVPVFSLLAAVALGWLVSRSEPAMRRVRRGLSPAWAALVAIAVGTFTARLSLAVDFHREEDPSAKARANAIDLDMKPYVGKPIAETPLAAYLPGLAAKLGNDTAFVVFYNPRCDACHTLFEANFQQPRVERVIAVEIPPPPGAVLVETDHHGPIECPSCEFETLAPGPVWLVAPPMTVKVERGVIVCVADRFGGDCINPQ